LAIIETICTITIIELNCVALRNDVLLAIVITHFKSGHNDDVIVVLGSIDVLLHFKSVRAKRDSLVVLVEQRVIKVIVDPGKHVTAVEVLKDEDEAKVTIVIHRTEEEVGVVLDSDREAAVTRHYFILVLRHNSFVAVVTEDGKDQRGCERGSHVVE
jgi:hypothetical protein